MFYLNSGDCARQHADALMFGTFDVWAVKLTVCAVPYAHTLSSLNLSLLCCSKLNGCMVHASTKSKLYCSIFELYSRECL